MRKLFSLLLVSLLLTSMASPVLGSNYRETAISYLTEKYGVPAERIDLYEGGTMEMEFTAEAFWYARYIIVPEGKSTSGSGSTGGERLPLPAPEPMPLPEPETRTLPAPDDSVRPDTPTQSSPDIMPIPPADYIDDGYIYGGIYIRIKTGEILEERQMEPYFSAESRLATQEWERLRQEAGKLDVSLYRKLQGLSATATVSVWIQPTPVETDELKNQFAALKEKYPEHTKGMTLTDFLPHSYGYAVPDMRGGGVSSFEVSTGNTIQATDAVTSYAVSDPAEPATRPLEKPGAELMPMPNDEYWQDYSAFWEELEQIRVQSVVSSLAEIREALEGMGVEYSDSNTSISAELTAAQINQIAELSAVAAVFEDAVFTTMDGNQDLAMRGSAAEEAAAPPGELGNESSPSYLPLILIAAVVLAAALVVYRRRTVRAE